MILVYKAYLYRSYVSQTEDCRLQAAEGSCTHCTVTMLQPSPRVTCHTCLPTPWSPGPVIVAGTRRSCSCGAFCGWRAHSVTRCCHVCRVWAAGHVSRVTCRRGEAGAASRSPGHPRCCWHMCGHWWLAAGQLSGQWSPPRTASLLVARLGQVSCRSARLPSGGGAGC